MLSLEPGLVPGVPLGMRGSRQITGQGRACQATWYQDVIVAVLSLVFNFGIMLLNFLFFWKGRRGITGLQTARTGI